MRSDDPRLRSAGPQRHSSNCAAAEKKTRSPGDKYAYENPEAGRAAECRGECKYLVESEPETEQAEAGKQCCLDHTIFSSEL